MNRLGILVDLSHVGSKTDEQLRTIVNKGGFVGVATYAPFMPKGGASTLDDCIRCSST